jgi:hypothetical protein
MMTTLGFSAVEVASGQVVQYRVAAASPRCDLRRLSIGYVVMELLILRLKQTHLHKGDGLQRNSLWVNLYNL